jgi:phenylpropionate dioxygenase-like ring-hydroxylating dioxygenase large terminal subunit
MAGIQQKLSTGKGPFTPRWPELGTGPVSYEDCISPAFFEDEQEAVFRRSWLYVGREERLPKPGTYFVRELPRLGSIVVTRDLDGRIHALGNVCAHRGNKVVWQEHPSRESRGACREFACKYHGWRYGLDGRLSHITREDQFFDLDKSALRMPKLHCDAFAGFIFVNFSRETEPLREFLGPRLLELESYPFGELRQAYGFECRIRGNWKIGMDALLEWYHPAYVHGRFIHSDVARAEKLVPPADAYHYDLFGRHMLTSVPGPPVLPPREGPAGPAKRDQNWVYKLFRAGLFGPDDVPDIGPLPEALNKGGIAFWGNDQFWFWPNLSVQIWARNYVITYEYWPESVDSHQYRVSMYFPEPENVAERLAQELTVCSTIEFAMQDSNTVEATQQAISARTQDRFQLSDLELMIRNFHKIVGDVVDQYRDAQRR